MDFPIQSEALTARLMHTELDAISEPLSFYQNVPPSKEGGGGQVPHAQVMIAAGVCIMINKFGTDVTFNSMSYGAVAGDPCTINSQTS